MNETDSGETPPGEHASEASGGQQGEEREGQKAVRSTHLDDPPLERRQVPGRRQASVDPIDHARTIPQQGRPQDKNPVTASGLTASGVAEVAFTTIQGYKRWQDDQDLYTWGELPQESRDEITGQVVAAITGQATNPARNHAIWCENMAKRGIRPEDNPYIAMRWAELPEVERRKAFLFEAVVRALLTPLG